MTNGQMSHGQAHLINTISAMADEDFASLDFITTLTTLIQKRAFDARSRKRPVTPKKPVVIVPKKPGLTQLRPHTGCTTLQQMRMKLRPDAPKPPVQLAVAKQTGDDKPWPFPFPSSTQTKDEKIVAWVEANISVGQIVKMKDTRDGHGLRLVTLFNFKDKTLNCARLVRVDTNDFTQYKVGDIVIVNDPSKPNLEYFTFSKHPTTHGMSKVVATVRRNGALNKSHSVRSIPDFSK